MAAIRLYIDEDLEEDAFVDGLRNQDIDVQTVTEAHLRDHSDEVQLEHAYACRRVLCTYNIRDFSRLHNEWLSEGRSHSGMILLHQQRLSVRERLRRFVRLRTHSTAESMVDRIEFLANW